MNPIHQLLCFFSPCEKRECPKCGTINTIEKSKKLEKVKCKNCTAILNPIS